MPSFGLLHFSWKKGTSENVSFETCHVVSKELSLALLLSLSLSFTLFLSLLLSLSLSHAHNHSMSLLVVPSTFTCALAHKLFISHSITHPPTFMSVRTRSSSWVSIHSLSLSLFLLSHSKDEKVGHLHFWDDSEKDELLLFCQSYTALTAVDKRFGLHSEPEGLSPRDEDFLLFFIKVAKIFSKMKSIKDIYSVFYNIN